MYFSPHPLQFFVSFLAIDSFLTPSPSLNLSISLSISPNIIYLYNKFDIQEQ